MPNVPVLRSPDQIAGDLVSGYTSRLPFQADLNAGAVVFQFFQSVKQTTFRGYASVIQMIDALSVDRAVGDALQRLARDRNVPIFPAIAATTIVSITDTSFQKLSSTIFAGQPAPVAGVTTLYVISAAGWPATGAVYVGRGTNNVEGPLQYTSLTQLGSGAYWQVTLSSTTPTTRFHNINETVVVAQGGIRTINIGAVCQTAQGASTNAVQFTTSSPASIQDGEVTVGQVPVICSTAGSAGNVPAGAIKVVLGLAFPGAASNPQPVTNGRNADTNDQIRNRIKQYVQTATKGTPLAIQTAAQGVNATDEQKTVVSANTITYADGDAALVYDDGTGDETTFTGVGVETLKVSAIGGETELQLRNRAVAQARVESTYSGPYDVPAGATLTVSIAGVITTHLFLQSDFQVPSAALPEEIAASVNGDPNANFLATTSNNDTGIVLYPRDNSKNEIAVINSGAATDVAAIAGFPVQTEYTLRMYEDGLPLYQDGFPATLETLPQSQWSSGIVSGDTLEYRVDGTPAITVTFTAAAFQAISPTSAPVSTTPISIWAEVMSSLMPGVTATISGSQIVLSSNLGSDSSASLELTGGSMLPKMFSQLEPQSSIGRTSDFTLNRQTGTIGLTNSLATGANVTAGTGFTEGRVSSGSIPSGPAAEGRIWCVVDGSAQFVPNGFLSTYQVRFSTVASSRTITVQAQDATTSLAAGFAGVLPGDWLLVWANSTDSPNLIANQMMLRVVTSQVGQLTVQGDVQLSTNTTPWISTAPNRIVIVRSPAPMQRFEFPSSSLSTFATEAPDQITGIASVVSGSTALISTLSLGSTVGEVTIAAADAGGQAIGYSSGTTSDSVPSQVGFVVTSDSEAGFPFFNFTATTAFTDDKHFTVANYLTLGGNYQEFSQVLNQYSVPTFSTVPDNDGGRRMLNELFNPISGILTCLTPTYMLSGASVVDPTNFDQMSPTVQPGTRLFLRAAYQFDSSDKLGVIVDGNDSTGSYSVEVARRLQVSTNSTPTTTSFSATDLESSLPLSSASSFGSFDFTDFKVWRQAHATLTNGTYSIVTKAADLGPSGNRFRIGFVYPSSVSQTSLSLLTGYSESVDLGIVLPVTTPRTPNWNSTSSFTVSVVTAGGTDQVTYTWRVGTQPNFTSAGVIAGDVAILSPQLQFLSDDAGFSGLVQSAGATSFTVQRPTGTAQADALQWDSAENVGGIITLVRAAGHGIQVGQNFGLYGTPILTGATRPFNAGGYAAVTATSTTVTSAVPPAVPGGAISSATFSSNIITVNSTAHGLFVGNVVQLSGIGSPYDGTYGVWTVPSPNQFQVVKTGFAASVATGRFDFQPIGPTGASSSATALVRTSSSNLVTVTLSSPLTLAPTQFVSISGVTVAAWVSGNVYNVGDVVQDTSVTANYKCTVGLTSTTAPHLDPTHWAPTTLDLSGTFPIATVIGGGPTYSQFTYYYSDATGATSATSASVVVYGYEALLARSIGGAASLLSFAAVGTKAQAVVDFITTSAAGQLAASTSTPTASINTSTADSYGYLSGTITSITSAEGSRVITINSPTMIIPGSTITASVGASQYNGSYVVQTASQVGLTWNMTAVSQVLAAATGVVGSSSGTYVGFTDRVMMSDGENFVASQNLGATVGNPMFTTKLAWNAAPSTGDEVRLLAFTADQLTRFWNLLAVTGLSSVAEIVTSQYGRQVQVSTDTVGGDGSIQVLPGGANSLAVAASGAGGALNGKLGVVQVPYQSRTGLVAGGWVTIANSTQNFKTLPFSQSTFLQLLSDSVLINSSESWVSRRSTTQDHTTVIRFEPHGRFGAIIAVSGTGFGLASGGVQEGDWVRMRNLSPSLWLSSTAYVIGNKARDPLGNEYVAIAASTNVPLTNASYWAPYNTWLPGTSYSAGQYVSYLDRLWLAAASSVGVTPGSSVTYWLPQEMNSANNGVFQVVRIFGPNAFWVYNPNFVEEVTQLLDPSDLSFYTYDSVMPGDQFVLSGPVLGVQNIGSYTVLDDGATADSTFPTAKQIYVTQVPAPGGSTQLGFNYGQVGARESVPASLTKRVFSVGPGPGTSAVVLLDSPNLMDKISSSSGAVITAQGKMSFPSGISAGLDGYKYYQGLVGALNQVLYGDPTDPTTYPGYVAAGASVDIKPSIQQRIVLAIAVRLATGIVLDDIVSQVQSAVAAYVNSLGTGSQVYLGQVIAAAESVNGVISAAMVQPAFTATSDSISVGADSRPRIFNAGTDISITQIGTS